MILKQLKSIAVFYSFLVGSTVNIYFLILLTDIIHKPQ